MSMEPLVTALLDLAHELPAFPQPVLVGGGFGLYLKQRHLNEPMRDRESVEKGGVGDRSIKTPDPFIPPRA